MHCSSQDFEGESGDARAGREYFKKRFARLAQKANQKEREIYIQCVPFIMSSPCTFRLPLLFESTRAGVLKRFVHHKYHNRNRHRHVASGHGCSRRFVYEFCPH